MSTVQRTELEQDATRVQHALQLYAYSARSILKSLLQTPFTCPRDLHLCLLCRSFLTLLPPRTLLEQRVSSVRKHLVLSVLDAHEPVAEAAADACVDGVYPERFAVEERSHFNAELP